MPTGTPIAIAIETDTSTSASVSIAASHTPRSPNDSTPSAVSTNIFQPASTPASAAAPTTSPSQVSRSSAVTVASTSASTVFSIGVRKKVNSGLVVRFWMAQSRKASNHAVTSTTQRSGNPGRSQTRPITTTTAATTAQPSRRGQGFGVCTGASGSVASEVATRDRGGATAISGFL